MVSRSYGPLDGGEDGLKSMRRRDRLDRFLPALSEALSLRTTASGVFHEHVSDRRQVVVQKSKVNYAAIENIGNALASRSGNPLTARIIQPHETPPPSERPSRPRAVPGHLRQAR